MRRHRSTARTKQGSIAAALGWLLIAALAGTCAGAEASFLDIGEQQDVVASDREPWTIQADTLSYDAKAKAYLAEGNVFISSGDRSIKADWARLDSVEQRAELAGNVTLRFGRDWLQGEHVIWNLDTETGWVDGGTVYFSESGFYVRGKNITKTGPSQYELQEGIITSCNPDDPDWTIRTRDLRVKVGGRGVAKHSSFWAGPIPLFYTPFAVFPVNRERQSGFLFPTLGSSSLNGFGVEVPYYWAIRQDMDATFTAHYMEERGIMAGMEYRIRHPKWGQGIWMVHYLDDQADKSHLRDEGYPFEQSDRYWVRGSHTFALPHEIEGFLTLDVVSDRNFLKEFERGSVGFDETNNALRRFSGREILNDKSVLSRESSLYLVRRNDNQLMSFDTRYWDNLDRSKDERTLQQLPRIAYDITPTHPMLSPFYYSLESAGVHYWRPEGDKGTRFDMLPRIYYPVHLWPYLVLEPSMGIRTTLYSVDWDDSDHSPTKARVLPDVVLELSSRMERVYAFNRWNITAVQHVVRPEFQYEWIPDEDQDDLPEFDRIDRIGNRHALRYGFSTFLISKRMIRDANNEPAAHYLELGRLRVTQAFKLDRSSDDDLLQTEAGKRFSNVDFELDLTPGSWLNLSYDVSVSPYDYSTTRHDLALGLRDSRNNALNLSYRYREDMDLDEIISGVHLAIRPNLFIYTYHDYSFDQKEMFEESYGVYYQHGCWGIRMGYKEEDEDREFMLAFTLLGLGQVGTGYVSGFGFSPAGNP